MALLHSQCPDGGRGPLGGTSWGQALDHMCAHSCCQAIRWTQQHTAHTSHAQPAIRAICLQAAAGMLMGDAAGGAAAGCRRAMA
jgi:hypothetical protein